MLRRASVLAAAVIVASFLVVPAASAGSKGATYEITITNLTDGQPLTPPAVALHRKPVHLFDVGDAAPYSIKEVAENGNAAPLLAELGGNKHVRDSFVAGATPLVPAADPGMTGFGDSVTFTIGSAKGAKYFSFVSMLICTNDGFTGLDGLRLPKKVGDAVTVTSDAYDAGTEMNTEDFANLVPPCQGLIGVSSGDMGTGMSELGIAELGVITHHGGIVGGDDLLPGTHGWTNPVVEISIERIA